MSRSSQVSVAGEALTSINSSNYCGKQRQGEEHF
jgi:hypothetical protein